MAVLLTESASLTSRETLTVLGRRGVAIDVISSGTFTIGRFSRWTRKSIKLPSAIEDPAAYVMGVGCLAEQYEAILPTHEQAWLLAVGRTLLPATAPIALASSGAFDQVQGKVAFAQLLDKLGLPQPRWWTPDRPPARLPPAYWVKSSFSTAGTGVRRVTSHSELCQALDELSMTRQSIMCQENAVGEYGQVQALFERGRMFAAHCSVRAGEGVGGSAAARMCVDHPLAREAAATIGRELEWHGGLTLDYFHVAGRPQFIECNPRTVEPGNAAAAGVDLPALTIALSRSLPLPEKCVIGRPGVLTHSSMALALGAAGSGSWRKVWNAIRFDGGPGSPSEVLTPIWEDPLSAIPFAVSVGRAMFSSTAARALAHSAVDRYAVTPEVIERLRVAIGRGPQPPACGSFQDDRRRLREWMFPDEDV
jgi:hypothetical protein